MRRRTSLLLVPTAVFAVTGCAEYSQTVPTTWEKLEVETLELELVHETRYEWFMFGPEGTVSATLGTKGGEVFGPLWYWRIEGAHLIISEQPKSDTYADLYEPRLIDNFVVVKRGFFWKDKYIVRRRK